MKEESKFAKFSKWITSPFFIVALLFLNVLYFYLLRFSVPVAFYLENAEACSCVALCGLIIANFLSSIMLMIRKRYLWGFILLSISIALSCLISLVTFNAPIFMDSAQLGNNSYYIVCNINIFEARGFEFLYKCDRNGLACEETSYSYWDGSSCDNNSYLIADHKNNEVDVVSGERGDKSSILQYAYGALPRYYDDNIQLDNHMFYLARVDHAYHPLTYILYECNLDNTSCNQLPFQYQPQSGDSAYNNIYIDSDETTDRVSVLKYPIANPEKLIYTYTVSSQHPQCYVDGCTTTNGQK